MRSERGGGQRVITRLFVERVRLAPVVVVEIVRWFWIPRSGRSRLRGGDGLASEVRNWRRTRAFTLRSGRASRP